MLRYHHLEEKANEEPGHLKRVVVPRGSDCFAWLNRCVWLCPSQLLPLMDLGSVGKLTYTG